MVIVGLADIDMAVDFATGCPGMETSAFIDRDSGEIFYVGEGVDEEPPADLYENERYIEIPGNQDLDLGRNLALEFADLRLPDDSDYVYSIFRSAGAYGKFKSLLERKDLLEAWYAFEADARARAITAWCEENGIECRKDSPANG